MSLPPFPCFHASMMPPTSARRIPRGTRPPKVGYCSVASIQWNSERNCLINSWRASRPWCTAGARGQNGACLPPYTRSRDPKIGPTSIYQTVSEGEFSETELPVFSILGNWVSGVQNSRKLNFYYYSFSETLYVGVILYAVDRGCMHELPAYGVLGNPGRSAHSYHCTRLSPSDR